MCSRDHLDKRGSCTVDPDVFGRVLDVRQPCEWSGLLLTAYQVLRGS